MSVHRLNYRSRRQSTPVPSTPRTTTPRITRLREARRQLRVGASALLDTTELLGPTDYRVAVKTIDLCDRLLIRLARAERQAAS